MLRVHEFPAREVFDTTNRLSQWQQTVIERRIGVAAMLATLDKFEALRRGDLSAAETLRDSPELQIWVELNETIRVRMGNIYDYRFSGADPWTLELEKGDYFSFGGETTLTASLKSDGTTEILKVRRTHPPYVQPEYGDKIRTKCRITKWDIPILTQAGVRLKAIIPGLESEEL